MRIRAIVAVWAGRMAGFLSRLTGRGGSSLPGLVALRLDPHLLGYLSQRLSWGSVLITGTNGKTTTAHLVARLLAHNQRSYLSNRAGANLMVGITAAFLQAERWRIRPVRDIALIETDEATMPRASAELAPRLVLVSNFFRDQLDRYGELSTTVGFVARGIEHLAAGGTLVLNADDPHVAQLARTDCRAIFYGLEGEAASDEKGYDADDARFCPRCHSALYYTRRYYAHLGHYRCSSCGWQRPRPDVAWLGSCPEAGTVRFRVGGETIEVSWKLPGLYNLYNLAAALAAGLALEVPLGAAQESLEGFRPAFGRMEELTLGDTRVWLALVKNPVGFNQVLSALADEPPQSYAIMVMINDRYADGQDVSWLWDVDFEHWAARLAPLVWYVSGVRAWDMAVRLKYAGVDPSRVQTDPAVSALWDRAVAETAGRTLYVLPTYTAMLELRQTLTQRGLVAHFREG